jgi:transcription elongation factor Elf1
VPLALVLHRRVTHTLPRDADEMASIDIELDSFEVSFSFRCPKCEYMNEEISANELSSGNAVCGMCETLFKMEGLDAVKIIASLE